MSDFALFQQALGEYNKTKPKVTKKSEKSVQKCTHRTKENQNGITLCLDCGEEIERCISYDKEWRYYGAADTKHISDPNRCYIRKNEERTIFKDVENMGFSDKVVSLANKYYTQVTNGKIYRGNSRKSIVFACIFYAYKILGTPQSYESLISIFKLERKAGLKGLKHVNMYAPKGSQIRTTYITPVNLVSEIMDKFQASTAQKNEVIELYNQIKNKSSILNRSRPRSISSSLVYYWICITKRDISLKDFKNIVGLSELTVNKITKEIARILGTENIICK